MFLRGSRLLRKFIVEKCCSLTAQALPLMQSLSTTCCPEHNHHNPHLLASECTQGSRHKGISSQMIHYERVLRSDRSSESCTFNLISGFLWVMGVGVSYQLLTLLNGFLTCIKKKFLPGIFRPYSLPVFGSFSFSLKVSENKPQRNTGHNNTLTIIHTVTNGAAVFHCAVFVCFIEVSSFVEVSVGMSENWF